MPDATLRKMEEYLKELRRALRSLPEGEAHDIVEEIRSHIVDTAGPAGGMGLEALAATLDRLGPPAELAARYRMGSLVQQARRSGSPYLVLRTIVRWAGLSVRGIWVLAASLAGYALAAAFLICAVAKPFNPGRVGLWKLHDQDGSWSLHLGFGTPPAGTEVLGWWIVPLGLLLGAGLFLFTARFGWWSLDRLRRELAIPGSRDGDEEGK